MTNDNPYHAYAEANMLSSNPLHLVVALYDGAIEATRSARACLESGDILARSRAINKGLAILTELMTCLDSEKGGEIAGNLKHLYSYMQRRLLEAHAKKSAAPMQEVEALLENLAEGWRKAAAKSSAAERVDNPGQNFSVLTSAGSGQDRHSDSEHDDSSYGYWNEAADRLASNAYSF